MRKHKTRYLLLHKFNVYSSTQKQIQFLVICKLAYRRIRTYKTDVKERKQNIKTFFRGTTCETDYFTKISVRKCMLCLPPKAMLLMCSSDWIWCRVGLLRTIRTSWRGQQGECFWLLRHIADEWYWFHNPCYIIQYQHRLHRTSWILQK